MSIASKRRYLKQKDEKSYLKKDQFRQAGLQFMDMAKDFVDTFKPYKSKAHLKRDLLQAYYGLRNFFLAVVLGALWVPLLLIVGVIIGPIVDFFTGGNNRALYNACKALYDLAGTLVNIVALAVRGLTQIVTAPLTWLRAIGRGLYAAINGWQAFHENAGVKRLVESCIITTENNDEYSRVDTIFKLNDLHTKMKKALSQGQPVLIEPTAFFSSQQKFATYCATPNTKKAKEEDRLDKDGLEGAQTHLGLFANPSPQDTQGQQQKEMNTQYATGQMSNIVQFDY